VRDIVGGFGADLVMDCSGHPSAGPEGIEFLRDGGTYIEMGQFTPATDFVAISSSLVVVSDRRGKM
jgi:threonine dehydrogenase-like Zn-dependent dehydrogenase